jgi:hypothetical protein
MPWIWRILLPKSQTTRDFYSLVAQGETRMTLNFWQKIEGSQCTNLLERRSRPSRESRKSAALWHTSSVPIWCSQSCKYPDPKLSDLRFLLETRRSAKMQWRQTDFANCFRYWKIHRCCWNQLLNPRIQNSSATKVQKFSIKQLTQSEYPRIL